MIDRVSLIGKLLHIVNKEGLVVPFKFNRGQSFFNRNKSGRNIILKHRQGGWSSSVLADMYMDCITKFHAQCAVISHETRATQRLLDRVQFYYDTMEEPKPELGSESRSEKTFPGLHSSIYIGTAGARAFGRGDTIRKALLSELAFYENGETILNAVEDAVPITGELTIECTPNGEDNVFYQTWIRAKEGKSPYKPFFFPWWWTSEYSIKAGSEIALPEDKGELSYTTEEQDLVDQHNLTEDQIRWRRWKIAEKGGLFWQEYPEDEVSCFITIGDPVFDQVLLNEKAKECIDGTMHPSGWQYWIPPDTTGKTRYVIGADSSAGSPTGSYSTAVVLDDLWRVCATFQGRVEPNTFARILKELGLWYNKAEIALERNFTGYAVLAALVGGYTEAEASNLSNYPNIYRQRDFLTGKVTANLGWWTNEQTKEHMRTALRDKLPSLRIWDINLIRQIRGYRFIKMKPTAQTFDDLAIALMIACAVKKVEGGSRGFQGKALDYSW
jgi:hypothetical protein